MRDKKYEEIATLFKYKKPDDLFEAIARSEISAQHISETLLRKVQKAVPTKQPLAQPHESGAVESALPVIPKVLVTGMKGFLTRTAMCCHPEPGDDIVGFVTQGRGVTIHRRECHNIERQKDNSRLIKVEWVNG